MKKSELRQMIREEYRRVLTEASEIEFSELPRDKQRSAQELMKVFRASKPDQVFDGIHGFIITFTGKVPGADGVRLNDKDLKALANNKDFRWIDIYSNTKFAIGL